MAENSKIEWTDSTWNPITGCTLVSEGCRHCYAAQLAATRLRSHPSRAGLARLNASGEAKFTGEVRLNEQWLDQPLRWRRPRRIFVCAHGDLFHEAVPDEWIDRVFAVMALAPQHTFQVLTKRPERAREYLTRPVASGRDITIDDAGRSFPTPAARWRVHSAMCDMLPKVPPAALNAAAAWQDQHFPDGDGFLRRWPLPNIWLGTSVEDQATADARIPQLLAAPAAVRFLSAEPLLGPVDLTRVGTIESVSATFPGVVSHEARNMYPEPLSGFQIDVIEGRHQATMYYQTPNHMGGFSIRFPRPWPRLDWVIVGGESGRHARPMHPDWARSLRDQCVAAGVPFFFKQWGAWLPESQDQHGHWNWSDAEEIGALHFWDDDRRSASIHLRKSQAGRILDGRTWDEMPEGAHG